jgi:hypothetical protein
MRVAWRFRRHPTRFKFRSPNSRLPADCVGSVASQGLGEIQAQRRSKDKTTIAAGFRGYLRVPEEQRAVSVIRGCDYACSQCRGGNLKTADRRGLGQQCVATWGHDAIAFSTRMVLPHLPTVRLFRNTHQRNESQVH